MGAVIAVLVIGAVELVIAWWLWLQWRELGIQVSRFRRAVGELAAEDGGRHAARGRHAVSPPDDHGSYAGAGPNGAAPRPGG